MHRPSGIYEQARERRVYAIPDQPSHAAGVVALPHRVGRKHYICGPARYGTGGEEDRITDGFIAAAAPVEHSRKHRHVEVCIVVHTHLALAVVEAMQSAGVLGNGSSPGNGKGQKQRVQPRIVEALTNVLPSSQNHSGLLTRDGRQPIDQSLALPLAHSRAQDDEMTDT
jgi:hypothetical protein